MVPKGIIFGNCVIMAGSALLAFVPFDKTRVRTLWAKWIFGILALLGIVKGGVEVAWNLGWFVLSDDSGRRLHSCLSFASGLVVGFLFSLIFSGQLIGSKRASAEATNDSTA